MTAPIAVARDSTDAPLRAPNATWLPPPPPKALAMSPPLALLQQYYQHQHEADEHVNSGGHVVQHLVSLRIEAVII